MKSLIQIGLVGACLGLGGIGMAQESEFQAKMVEDLEPWQKRIVKACGTTDTLTVKWEGKLGFNPRESDKGYDGISVGSLVDSSLDALEDACLRNTVLKKTFSKVTAIVLVRGKGIVSYKLAGSKLTFSVDPTSFNGPDTNPAGQRDKLLAKIKKDLDK